MISINLNYPVLVYEDEEEKGTYNVIMPDIDGMFVSGTGRDDALEKAKKEIYNVLGGQTVYFMDSLFLDGSMRPIWKDDDYFRLPSDSALIKKRFKRGEVVSVEISVSAYECDIPF